MTEKQLKLQIITQNEVLTDTLVDSVTAPASEGQVTILPGHLPLFSRLSIGEVLFRVGSTETELVISKGFIDVGDDNSVTIIVDVATYERDISLQKAELAVAAAKEELKNSRSKEELLLAEASLRQAMLEVKVAQKSRRNRA